MPEAMTKSKTESTQRQQLADTLHEDRVDLTVSDSTAEAIESESESSNGNDSEDDSGSGSESSSSSESEQSVAKAGSDSDNDKNNSDGGSDSSSDNSDSSNSGSNSGSNSSDGGSDSSSDNSDSSNSGSDSDSNSESSTSVADEAVVEEELAPSVVAEEGAPKKAKRKSRRKSKRASTALAPIGEEEAEEKEIMKASSQNMRIPKLKADVNTLEELRSLSTRVSSVNYNFREKIEAEQALTISDLRKKSSKKKSKKIGEEEENKGIFDLSKLQAGLSPGSNKYLVSPERKLKISSKKIDPMRSPSVFDLAKESSKEELEASAESDKDKVEKKTEDSPGRNIRTSLRSTASGDSKEGRKSYRSSQARSRSVSFDEDGTNEKKNSKLSKFIDNSDTALSSDDDLSVLDDDDSSDNEESETDGDSDESDAVWEGYGVEALKSCSYMPALVKFVGYADEFEKVMVCVDEGYMKVKCKDGFNRYKIATFNCSDPRSESRIVFDENNSDQFDFFHRIHGQLTVRMSLENMFEILEAMPNRVFDKESKNPILHILKGYQRESSFSKSVASSSTPTKRRKSSKSSKGSKSRAGSESKGEARSFVNPTINKGARKRSVEYMLQGVGAAENLDNLVMDETTLRLLKGEANAQGQSDVSRMMCNDVVSADVKALQGADGVEDEMINKTNGIADIIVNAYTSHGKDYRQKNLSNSRARLLCHWINDLMLQPAHVHPETLHENFVTGLLLADLVRCLIPADIDHFKPLHVPCMTRAQAVENLEQSLGIILRSKSFVFQERVCSAEDIVTGDTRKILVLIDELFRAFVVKDFIRFRIDVPSLLAHGLVKTESLRSKEVINQREIALREEKKQRREKDRAKGLLGGISASRASISASNISEIDRYGLGDSRWNPIDLRVVSRKGSFGTASKKSFEIPKPSGPSPIKAPSSPAVTTAAKNNQNKGANVKQKFAIRTGLNKSNLSTNNAESQKLYRHYHKIGMHAGNYPVPTKRLATMIMWYQSILQHYQRGFPATTLQVFRRAAVSAAVRKAGAIGNEVGKGHDMGGYLNLSKALEGVWSTVQSGVALFCVLLHFCGDKAQLTYFEHSHHHHGIQQSDTEERSVRVDPMLLYGNPISQDHIRYNMKYVFRLMAGADVKVVLGLSDWLVAPQPDFMLMQLYELYLRFEGETCKLPLTLSHSIDSRRSSELAASDAAAKAKNDKDAAERKKEEEGENWLDLIFEDDEASVEHKPSDGDDNSNKYSSLSQQLSDVLPVTSQIDHVIQRGGDSGVALSETANGSRIDREGSMTELQAAEDLPITEDVQPDDVRLVLDPRTKEYYVAGLSFADDHLTNEHMEFHVNQHLQEDLNQQLDSLLLSENFDGFDDVVPDLSSESSVDSQGPGAGPTVIPFSDKRMLKHESPKSPRDISPPRGSPNRSIGLTSPSQRSPIKRAEHAKEFCMSYSRVRQAWDIKEDKFKSAMEKNKRLLGGTTAIMQAGLGKTRLLHPNGPSAVGMTSLGAGVSYSRDHRSRDLPRGGYVLATQVDMDADYASPAAVLQRHAISESIIEHLKKAPDESDDDSHHTESKGESKDGETAKVWKPLCFGGLYVKMEETTAQADQGSPSVVTHYAVAGESLDFEEYAPVARVVKAFAETLNRQVACDVKLKRLESEIEARYEEVTRKCSTQSLSVHEYDDIMDALQEDEEQMEADRKFITKKVNNLLYSLTIKYQDAVKQCALKLDLPWEVYFPSTASSAPPQEVKDSGNDGTKSKSGENSELSMVANNINNNKNYGDCKSPAKGGEDIRSSPTGRSSPIAMAGHAMSFPEHNLHRFSVYNQTAIKEIMKTLSQDAADDGLQDTLSTRDRGRSAVIASMGGAVRTRSPVPTITSPTGLEPHGVVTEHCLSAKMAAVRGEGDPLDVDSKIPNVTRTTASFLRMAQANHLKRKKLLEAEANNRIYHFNTSTDTNELMLKNGCFPAPELYNAKKKTSPARGSPKTGIKKGHRGFLEDQPILMEDKQKLFSENEIVSPSKVSKDTTVEEVFRSEEGKARAASMSAKRSPGFVNPDSWLSSPKGLSTTNIMMKDEIKARATKKALSLTPKKQLTWAHGTKGTNHLIPDYVPEGLSSMQWKAHVVENGEIAVFKKFSHDLLKRSDAWREDRNLPPRKTVGEGESLLNLHLEKLSASLKAAVGDQGVDLDRIEMESDAHKSAIDSLLYRAPREDCENSSESGSAHTATSRQSKSSISRKALGGSSYQIVNSGAATMEEAGQNDDCSSHGHSVTSSVSDASIGSALRYLAIPRPLLSHIDGKVQEATWLLTSNQGRFASHRNMNVRLYRKELASQQNGVFLEYRLGKGVQPLSLEANGTIPIDDLASAKTLTLLTDTTKHRRGAALEGSSHVELTLKEGASSRARQAFRGREIIKLECLSSVDAELLVEHLNSLIATHQELRAS